MSAIFEKAQQLDDLLSNAVQDDKENGVFRCRRDIFTNADLYELEMKHIFESNWVYLAHESQIPNNNDYYTTFIGRQPIVITRDKTGELHAVINACAHKGAMLCRRKHGNKGTFTCPFHGWTFSNAGKLLKVKDEKTTQYPVQFNKQGSHDLKKVARFQNYRGFLFGSLNADVVPSAASTGITLQRWVDARSKAPKQLMRTAGANRSPAFMALSTVTYFCGPRR
jgi:benzoate/toluate 1,2-dioxygenase alpha subunit